MILLDTNVLLWFFAGDERLSTDARTAIEIDPGNYLVSTVSFWEIAIKRQIGKLITDLDMPQAVENAGFIILDITTAHIYSYESLPLLHRGIHLIVCWSLSQKLNIFHYYLVT